MSSIRLVGTSALVLVTLYGGVAQAVDVAAKNIFIKSNADQTKQKLQVYGKDIAIHHADAVAPDTNGTALHLYSSSDDLCVQLGSGTDPISNKPRWKDTGTKWKYKDKGTKTTAQIKDGKLLIKVKGHTYTLNEPTQGTVNAQVQFGTGVRFCMKCSGNKKDDTKKFLGKDCAATSCDAEPSTCDPPGATTTTTTTTTSTTTTTCPPGPPASPTILKGSLTATLGRFNYNLTLGLPGANSACNSNFPGTHACTYQELQAAAAACDLPSLKDTALNTVTSFWAIDSLQPILQQCNDDAMGGSNLNWEYATAHTASRGQRVLLDNTTGGLGALQSSVQCNIGGAASNNWVGCCQ